MSGFQRDLPNDWLKRARSDLLSQRMNSPLRASPVAGLRRQFHSEGSLLVGEGRRPVRKDLEAATLVGAAWLVLFHSVLISEAKALYIISSIGPNNEGYFDT